MDSCRIDGAAHVDNEIRWLEMDCYPTAQIGAIQQGVDVGVVVGAWAFPWSKRR